MTTKPSAQAVFLMLARNHEARRKATKTIRRVAGRWNVRIGGPVKGQTYHVRTRRAAELAVHRHYDDRLHSALDAPGWHKHLDRLVAGAIRNGNPMTLRQVVGLAWRRRRWVHTQDHHWQTKNGRRLCTLCESSRKLSRYAG